MKVIALGVGEWRDGIHPNNSHLVISGDTSILLDCGRGVPEQLRKLDKGGDWPDAVYLSHDHPDHCCGLVPLLSWGWHYGRKKAITIICRRTLAEFMTKVVELAYYYETGNFNFPILFADISADMESGFDFNGLGLKFAPTNHSVDNLAVRIDDGSHVVCYSGDGEPTAASAKLYHKADLLIHEGFSCDTPQAGHGFIPNVITVAEQQQVGTLWLTHLQKEFRQTDLLQVKHQITSQTVKVVIPEPLHEFVA